MKNCAMAVANVLSPAQKEPWKSPLVIVMIRDQGWFHNTIG